MGISFKVSKTGTRFCRRDLTTSCENLEKNFQIVAENESNLNKRKHECNLADGIQDFTPLSASSYHGKNLISSDYEVSFALNLFLDGFSVGKPTEEGKVPLPQNVPNSLFPYDKSSELLFSAIESGHLPVNLLDEMPNKYFDGMLLCEIRDYRKSMESGKNGYGFPIVNKVLLCMTMENVIRDVPLMSDDSWTYRDILEIESRILKTLQPKLCLDPKPKLDRLSSVPINKIDLDVHSLRRKRLRQLTEVMTIPNTQTHHINPQIISNEPNCKLNHRVHGISSSQHSSGGSFSDVRNRTFGQEPLPSLLNTQPVASYSRVISDRGYGSPAHSHPVISECTSNSNSSQDMVSLYPDSGKGHPSQGRENQDNQLGIVTVKGAKQLGVDVGQQQALNAQLAHQHGIDEQWKSSMLQQRYPHQALSDVNKQSSCDSAQNQQPVYLEQGLQYGIKQEHVEADILSKQEFEMDKYDTRMLDAGNNQQLSSHSLIRSHFPPQTQWHSQGVLEKEKERKSSQSPRISVGPLVHGPVSKPGEIYTHIGASSAVNPQGLQREKPTTVVPSPMVSSPNDTIQRPYQAAIKRRSNSISKTQSTGLVSSPASTGNANTVLNVSSPSVGTPALADQSVLERFSKLEMIALRHNINSKQKKEDNYPQPQSEPLISWSQDISVLISNALNAKDVNSTESVKSMSKSLEGGSINVCKTRVLTAEKTFNGNYIDVSRSRERLILLERPNDGTVAMLYGDTDEIDFLSIEEYLPTLPNTHFADLLAMQFLKLMMHDEYQVDDRVLARSIATNPSTSNIPCPSLNDNQTDLQCQDTLPGQPSNIVLSPSNGVMSSSQNILVRAQMPLKQNTQSLQMTQGYLPSGVMPSRSQEQNQIHQPPSQPAQLQQQPSQMQRSSLMLHTNPLSHLGPITQNSNSQITNQMMNKSANLHQYQMLQQQQRQKMMIGAAIGNMGNSVVGLSGLGNVMSIGGVRGMNPSFSSPMGSLSNLGNVGQNPMNLSNMISQQLRTGNMTPAQAAAMTSIRIAAQNRSMMGSQSNLAGMPGNGQVPANLSMMGQRANNSISSLQRTAMSTMGPPKIPMTNSYYINQQQQLQYHQMQQQQQQQMNSQLQQPIQSTMSQQRLNQQPSQQQMNTSQINHQNSISAQQLNPGVIPQLNPNSNTGTGGPGSPQLSSQSLVSGGNITGSPMDHGVISKSNSINNV